MGLNEIYSGGRSQILLINPLPTVTKVYSLVNKDESQRGMTTGVTNANETTCFSNKFKMTDMYNV